jgi:hypothetical protein
MRDVLEAFRAPRPALDVGAHRRQVHSRERRTAVRRRSGRFLAGAHSIAEARDPEPPRKPAKAAARRVRTGRLICPLGVRAEGVTAANIICAIVRASVGRDVPLAPAIRHRALAISHSRGIAASHRLTRSSTALKCLNTRQFCGRSPFKGIPPLFAEARCLGQTDIAKCPSDARKICFNFKFRASLETPEAQDGRSSPPRVIVARESGDIIRRPGARRQQRRRGRRVCGCDRAA